MRAARQQDLTLTPTTRHTEDLARKRDTLEISETSSLERMVSPSTKQRTNSVRFQESTQSLDALASATRERTISARASAKKPRSQRRQAMLEVVSLAESLASLDLSESIKDLSSKHPNSVPGFETTLQSNSSHLHFASR